MVRALESAAQPDGTVAAGEGETRLLIAPGYRFRVVDRLVTNFHLPRSTLLMLVAAFAGYERDDGGVPSRGGGAVPLLLLRRRDVRASSGIR